MAITNVKVGDILEYQIIDSKIPAFLHNSKDAGYDLYTVKTKWIWPFKITKIPVNIKMILPDNTFGLITTRSCVYDMGIDILNGIIDEPYRGIPHVAGYRVGLWPKRIPKGSRIAQLIILPYVEPYFVESEIKNDTYRGEKGFGSTGV